MADVVFPLAGLDISRAFGDQRRLPMLNGDYGRTTRDCLNVRGNDTEGRARGGTRPGLVKFLDDRPNDWVVQNLSLIVSAGTAVQTSASGRVVTLVHVSQGDVYYARAGDTSWTQATNNTGRAHPLNFTGVIQSTSLLQRMYFADGANWCYYDPSTNAVNTFSASTGSLPSDSQGNLPRLCTTWRGRLIFSGVLYDQNNFFCSRVGEPTDFNYSPSNITPDQAVKGDSGPLGVVGDEIRTMIPWSNDRLVFGCDHEIHVLAGDPMTGGQLDRVTDSIGMAWGSPWCVDYSGNLYFMSNRGRVYRMEPGARPIPISQQIDRRMQDINTGTHTITLGWDDENNGLCVFVTPTLTSAAATHYFCDAQTGGWFPFSFANPDHNPLVNCVFDGNDPEDRKLIIGSWDGYVRYFDNDATTDDGEDIESYVVLGPYTTPNLDDVFLRDMQAVLSETSGTVTAQVYVGSSAEIALSRTAVWSGTWRPGRNLNCPVNRAGHGVYIRLSSDDAWQMENIRMGLEVRGEVRARGR